ncbi:MULTISPECIES: type VI secretion system protein TssA [Aeromonas]|uniref:type VI secretion system protein TssA n=1 Tax=Aeromonas TaxID=642 RepID=UPI001C247657|nr:type VI secretion system protein TssA [Aeromonas sp. FDAARGOS 1408]ELM3749375.1 type VI secretion system protein TssA [Aeromonas dhakensis]QXC09555.1 type VI secretion system protein TssA [Aeromonas sp. FDAARGOS 1408]HDX8342804.1 type VI secretion system protein TssA [Aeromonas dhakensis]
MSYQHPWCARLLTSLPDEQIRGAVLADEPRWDYVETELVKLGSLAHSQVDLNAVAEACLGLLESRTKDMRVLAQLLRCLQHPAKATPLGAAISLLEAWIQAYWLLAWPGNTSQKQRLMVQIVKRFEGALPRICESASAAELAQLLAQAEQLERVWLAQCPDKGELLDPLVMGLKRAQRQQVAQAQADAAGQSQSSGAAAAGSPTAAGPSASGAMVLSGGGGSAGIDVDSSNDRAWRQTQLKVAELLIERQPEAAVGYRLRRHAVWAGITAVPMSGAGNKTPLAPMSADMVDEYRAAMNVPEQGLWQRIEQSLTLAPYWFEGHRLSAEVAQKLGFGAVAQAIAEELGAFLQRLPALRELAFSDGSPFLSPECSRWLQPAKGGSAGSGEAGLAEEVAQRHGEQGVAAALALLDERMTQLKEPRDRFHALLVQAELLAQEGMEALARQHYQHLWQEASRLGLSHWEPGLVNRLESLAAPLSK